MVFNEPRFYFTVHPGDMIRGRIIMDCHIMLVASACWDNERGRFKISRPPADHISSICIDSGGFTAAKRWGRYPWTIAQYAEWIGQMSRDVILDFCAVMDYACEPTVNRSILATNQSRIEATIENEIACKEVAPGLPWLPVLQGDNLAERTYDLDRRREMGLRPTDYAGIGSVCGRGAHGARQVVKFYADRLPGVKYHGFGMHIQALDDDAVYGVVKSWDSYSWNWGRGQKGVDRPAECHYIPSESWTTYTRRLAQFYWDKTISPRIKKDRQGLLW